MKSEISSTNIQRETAAICIMSPDQVHIATLVDNVPLAVLPGCHKIKSLFLSALSIETYSQILRCSQLRWTRPSNCHLCQLYTGKHKGIDRARHFLAFSPSMATSTILRASVSKKTRRNQQPALHGCLRRVFRNRASINSKVRLAVSLRSRSKSSSKGDIFRPKGLCLVFFVLSSA